MSLKITQTKRETSFIGGIETQRLSNLDGRERHILELTKICHWLRRID
jgi:hypothetical protein